MGQVQCHFRAAFEPPDGDFVWPERQFLNLRGGKSRSLSLPRGKLYGVEYGAAEEEENRVRERRTVLFLCTGNYYRSRFAEALFDAVAVGRGLDWRAESRGLAIERGVGNVGPMAAVVVGR